MELEEGMDIGMQKYWGCIGMMRFGGSFVKSLGSALLHADMFNVGRIKVAFPEYWAKYLVMGKETEGRG